jgi:hypothetical protein
MTTERLTLLQITTTILLQSIHSRISGRIN